MLGDAWWFSSYLGKSHILVALNSFDDEKIFTNSYQCAIIDVQ